MEARDILVRPLITERTTQLMAEGKYVFVVAKAANKIEIAKAVAEVFKVKVAKVNTVNVTGKKKRMGRTEGKRPDYKKAIVKLAPGETIEFFEG
ncbi:MULTISPECIES: 50S ribosomal protein L23 [Selenomonas]|jgi:ribosomal protein L23|uniref:50S ribosomal protein L23 n=1 Tax=Selenomonas TaxID=970 RepID=UPI0001E097E9|nr:MULTISPECIES: 50S ribosomal protein L23 [Selenomonas]AKT53388.1 50S ribosomal protein L23 [Selenomonas sp. oral taxon 478]AME04003.1 50S ribosomal protein L23 [Selenomonas sp. oral taxon 136]EFM22414.1 ribosomal protein L23 [Selenomonas sp. oral taxon 149 str. 67H29BP]MBF1683217.1 50S ribosomal protein L23 [Selenomonas sp.]MBF1687244.1 50S ribosomal protein L23 [Selenomonas sp.]